MEQVTRINIQQLDLGPHMEQKLREIYAGAGVRINWYPDKIDRLPTSLAMGINAKITALGKRYQKVEIDL